MDLLECCDICGEDHNTVICPELGLTLTQTEPHLLTRARLTLPPNLEVVDNGQGLIGVVTKETIEKKTQFGPFEAKRTTHVFEDNGFFTLKLLGKDGTTVVLDTTDENECNWMCLVRSALSTDTQNCMAYQLGTNIFYNTTRQICEGEELQVWYAPHFAKKLGKPSLPDPNTQVLLGHRIEPLALEIQNEAQEGEVIQVALEDNQEEPPVITDAQQLTGEIVKVHQCPRCPKVFKTQTEMVKHLREHILPNAYSKDKNSQTPVARGRGRPRIHPIKVENESSTPKRKRGRPPKNNIDSYDEVGDDDLEDNLSDESDEPEKKQKLSTFDDDVLDKDYSPLKEVESFSRRIQPKRSLKGQYSKYSNDFVLGKIVKKVQNKKDLDAGADAVGDGNTKAMEVKKFENVGKQYGSPRKSVAAWAGIDSRSGSSKEMENGTDLHVKIPSRTYERKIVINEQSMSRSVGTSLTSNTNIIIEKTTSVDDNFPTVEVVIKDEPNKLVDSEADNSADKHDDDVSNEEIKPENDDVDEMRENADGEGQIIVVKADTSDVVEETGDGSTNSGDLIDKILHIDSVKTAVSDFSENNTEKRDVTDQEMTSEEETKKLADEILDESGEDALTAFEEMTEEKHTEERHEEKDVSTGNKACNTDVNAKTNTAKELTQNFISEQIIVVNDKEGKLYKCKICEKVFTKLNYLKLHIPKHTDKYKCEKCGKTFTRNDSLQRHNCGVVRMLLEQPLEEIVKVLEKEGKETYECVKCSKNFDSQVDAVAHYMIHSSEMLSCLKCNKVLEKGQTLADHECSEEESQYAFPCDICSQSFKSAKYLHRHLVIHTDMFKCKKCKYCFSRKDSLHKHVLKCCPELAESYKILYCSLCYRVFSTKSGKMNHASKCKWVKCENCARVFSSNNDMESHECYKDDTSAETPGVEFSCGKCGKTFLNNYYLSQHQVIHDETYQCNVCKKNLKTQDELTSHNSICKLVQKIRTTGEAMCDLCSEIFTKPKLLRLHYHIHTHPFECDKCHKRFMKASGLAGHSCKSVEGTFSCKECDKSFTSKRFLVRHTAYSHSKQIYHCNFCGKGFNRRLKFQNHVCKLEDGSYGNIVVKKGKRLVIEKLVCDTCGKTFSSRSNLNKHVISHGERQCCCKHCGKMFHYENYLRDHISSVHFNIHKYQCTDCGKLMKSKTGLIAHVKQFHRENADIFTCEVCGKCFKQKGNLQTHMYSHQTERNFVCEFCHKSFKYPDQLSRHRLIHTMQNKLQCSCCEKKFVKEYELKRHEMIFHSGLVYVCAVCFARCGHKHTLIRHYKRKHPGNVDELNVPGVLDGMLKRLEELPEQGTEEELEPQLIENIDLINGPIMPTQDAAEVLHSLSNVAAMIEPLSENRKPELEPSFLPSENTEGDQTIQIQLQPNTEIQQAEIIQQANIQLSQEQIITDAGQLQFEVRTASSDENTSSQEAVAEDTITMNNGVININGQYIPLTNLHTIPQENDVTDTGEGHIVILQIWDPQAEEHGTQEQLIQIQGDPLIAVQEETNLS